MALDNPCREQIFANQKRLGVIPANAQLTSWPNDLPKWDSLSADQEKLFARQAEVFAAYAAYTDHEIGRFIFGPLFVQSYGFLVSYYKLL